MTEDLKKVFKALITLHQELLQKAQEKEAVVKKNDIEGLERIMKEETPLISRLEKLELARRQIVQRWLQQQGIVAEDATMEQLKPAFSASDQAAFDELQETLRAIITEVQQQNDLNRQLITESLRYLNLSLSLVEPQDSFTNYSGRGSEEDGKERSVFDSQA
ncbi:flagellar protein FlgN [Alkalicoccus chagannorensis]|uniref:flagellar protein FlgN n=1 Tax=Alkalicoccus chagannorensis TaxID=427072 RepID=UPI00042A5C19|nr:flagellar protein FlgN [Alkalicoccus chagannorensis]